MSDLDITAKDFKRRPDPAMADPDKHEPDEHIRADTPANHGKAVKAIARFAGAAAAGALLGAVGIYGMNGLERNVQVEASCGRALEIAERIAPLTKGHVAALVPSERAVSLADLAFTKEDGTKTTLAEWKGRTVLLNLWATWCVPCRLEMPALDRLEKELGGPRFEVVAVNVDTKDADRPLAFLKEINVGALDYFADPTLTIFKDLQRRGLSRGMPTTILIDAEGCEIGTMNGPAEWDHADAVKLVQAAMAD